MGFPLEPPIAPQLARGAKALPDGPGWAYEPKYDGYRALVFAAGAERLLQSRSGKPLDRYFPELSFPDGDYVLDGELIIAAQVGGEDFSALSQRIHPAASRIAKLSVELPARLIAFDLLARDGETLVERPFAERRAALEAFIGALGDPAPYTLALAPTVAAAADAEHWLREAEGVVAKRLEAPYLAGERKAMVKVKRLRTLDAVLVGWRPGKEEGTVGSLILGLYEPDGTLREVGHTSGLSARRKRELIAELAPYETGERGTGEPSRWTGGRDLTWVALRPELVVEVSFDHVSGGRIRHGTTILRWREDKPPRACTIDQLDQ